MVELARLESECALTRTVGSNPTLSAKASVLEAFFNSIHNISFNQNQP